MDTTPAHIHDTSGVRTADPSDVHTVAATLASAFAEDPVMRWTLGDVADPAQRLVHGFAAMVRAGRGIEGHHVALTADGTAAVIWRDVGRWKSSTGHMLRVMPGLLRAFRSRTPLLLRGLSMIEQHHPSEPHYYLEVLGTRADQQGRGLGSDALAPMLERCDQEGRPAYAESSNPKNLPFYARHGFETLGELRLRHDSPPIFRIWREPR